MFLFVVFFPPELFKCFISVKLFHIIPGISPSVSNTSLLCVCCIEGAWYLCGSLLKEC